MPPQAGVAGRPVESSSMQILVGDTLGCSTIEKLVQENQCSSMVAVFNRCYGLLRTRMQLFVFNLVWLWMVLCRDFRTWFRLTRVFGGIMSDFI